MPVALAKPRLLYGPGLRIDCKLNRRTRGKRMLSDYFNCPIQCPIVRLFEIYKHEKPSGVPKKVTGIIPEVGR